MSEDLTQREALLIELIWLLSHGTEDEMGYSLQEVMKVLDARVRTRDMKKVLEVLDEEGYPFLQEIKNRLLKD